MIHFLTSNVELTKRGVLYIRACACKFIKFLSNLSFPWKRERKAHHVEHKNSPLTLGWDAVYELFVYLMGFKSNGSKKSAVKK